MEKAFNAMFRQEVRDWCSGHPRTLFLLTSLLKLCPLHIIFLILICLRTTISIKILLLVGNEELFYFVKLYQINHGLFFL